MARHSNYDKFPFIPVTGNDQDCATGWEEVSAAIAAAVPGKRSIVCVECYPGANLEEIESGLVPELSPTLIIRASSCCKDSGKVLTMLAPYLGGVDPVFGRMNGVTLQHFLDESKVAAARNTIRSQAAQDGTILVIGTGAALITERYDLLIYADLARWELTLRQRRGEIGNLGADNLSELPNLKYKRAFFVDWRAADRLKKILLPKLDFLLDANSRGNPKLVRGELLRRGLVLTSRRPFRVVPYFDPGVWGGHWMEEVCDLPRDRPNHAWCFDCVPEENSLLLGFGSRRIEIPSINLVFSHPRDLLGDAVHGRFGTEFPIRFDFLDTMGGGNLSLQVHPLTEYIQDKFGMNYTQDESYYLLDAGEDGTVYLGVLDGVDPEAMFRDLREAQKGGMTFDAKKYVGQYPAKKHDHFLIPAGTIHCSGENSMVLEISATPYIFTFKLWDWGRVGLDGRPRPIHIDHGEANVQWDRTPDWVKHNLIGQVQQVRQGAGWREERTGLHEREFIETRRHWFRGPVEHDTQGGVNVLNLVAGEQAVVESPTGAFVPFVVHYAETFIVPAAVGKYSVRPHGAGEGQECATLKAFVRARP
ncbi:MAG TPA: class I mannose-6-phosphate isomerase [Candidatus Saccharimonadales bacterium]|nr:class I mannose-6-phosphate isomerase [Candidatus Saccharimonadales bacterium]